MSRWSEFLRSLSAFHEIAIVGPLHHAPEEMLLPTVYVDGGARFKISNYAPAIVVGDGDSFCGPHDELLPQEKDFSDLAFVLRQLPAHLSHLKLFGFLGGRRDHELANLGEVHRFLKQRQLLSKVEFFEGDERRILAVGAGTLKVELNGIFSIFTLERARIQMTGACHFTLENPTELSPLSSHGLSNKGHGSVTLSCDAPCFILCE